MKGIKTHNNCNRLETAVALGNFDGIHLGHKKIILKMIEASKEFNLIPSILLFNTHTKAITEYKTPMCLTSNSQKENIVSRLGVEKIYNIDFDKNFMKLLPEEFVKNILVDKLNTKLVVVGFDYRFGHKASGNVETLKDLGKKYGFQVIVLQPIFVDNIIVSSTKIRELISNGDIDLANRMLDKNYQIVGKVIPGNKVGRTLGFPTANIELSNDYVLPKHGVYRTKTIIGDKTYLSVTNVGYNPTFNNDKVKIECHIIDFSEEIYDRLIHVEFIEYLRGGIKFDNLEGLIKEIDNDVNTVISRH